MLVDAVVEPSSLRSSCVYWAQVRITGSYTTSTGEPRSCRTELMLPLALFCQVSTLKDEIPLEPLISAPSPLY